MLVVRSAKKQARGFGQALAPSIGLIRRPKERLRMVEGRLGWGNGPGAQTPLGGDFRRLGAEDP